MILTFWREHKCSNELPKPFICAQCGKGYTRKETLYVHEDRHHQPPQATEDTYETPVLGVGGAGPINPTLFNDQQASRRSMRVGDTTPSGDLPHRHIGPDGPFFCNHPTCELKRFKNKNLLQQHVMKHSADTGDLKGMRIYGFFGTRCERNTFEYMSELL